MDGYVTYTSVIDSTKLILIGGMSEPEEKLNRFVLVDVKSNRWQIYPDFPHSYNTDQMAAIVTFDKSGKRY